ncbi:MAG: hypothetical protein IMZ41_01950 [Actinobacteria bacterium]|nr:hypothetical protein [Actinomycetota bacterium]
MSKIQNTKIITSEPEPNRIIAYYISWGVYARNYQVSNIPAEKVTYINYAFANISQLGVIAIGDSNADKDRSNPGNLTDLPFKKIKYKKFK